MSLQLRALTLNDCEPWAELLAVAFDRTSADMVQLLHWLSAEHELIAWGAWENMRLIAQYSSLLTAVWLPSNSLECVGLSINLAVHPDYRGRGLVKQMAQPVYTTLANRGVIAGVGFSNAAGVKVDRHSRGYGYQVIGQMKSRLIVLSSSWHNIEPVRLTTDWPALPFEFTSSTHSLIRFAASPALARHRFAQHPFRRYQFGVWETTERVCGVVVYRLVQWHGMRLAAFLAAYSDDVPALLARWAAALHHAGIHFIQLLTTPASKVCTALRNNGVSVPLPYTRSPYFLTVKPLHAAASPLLNFKHWDCSGGDIL